MSVRMVIALLMVAIGVLASFAHAEEPFESYPHIRCEACKAMAAEVGERMNETNKVKTSIQSSFRIDSNNERRTDYESSELRAVEILDRICDTFFNSYFLRVNNNTDAPDPTKRFFSKDKTLKRAPFYGKADKAILGAPSRKLQQYCLQLLDESDTVFTQAIMKKRTADDVENYICHEKLKICSNQKAIEKSLAKEAKYRAAHIKLKEKRRMKKIAAQRAAAEAEKKAAEAAGGDDSTAKVVETPEVDAPKEEL